MSNNKSGAPPKVTDESAPICQSVRLNVKPSLRVRCAKGRKVPANTNAAPTLARASHYPRCAFDPGGVTPWTSPVDTSIERNLATLRIEGVEFAFIKAIVIRAKVPLLHFNWTDEVSLKLRCPRLTLSVSVCVSVSVSGNQTARSEVFCGFRSCTIVTPSRTVSSAYIISNQNAPE